MVRRKGRRLRFMAPARKQGRTESRWLSTRYIGVLGSHRYKVVLGLAQLGGPPSGRVGPWRSGDCKSSFPDTFEPERIRTTQCESVQLWQ